MTSFYYLSSTGWKQIEGNIIYPINATFGIDGGTDTMQLSYYSNTDFYIPVDTPIKVVTDADNLYFVVKDSDYNDMPYVNLKTQQAERLCTLSLVEPFEVAKGYKLQACKFAENKYTIKSILDRIKVLSRFDFDYLIPENILNYTVKTRISFASTTVYLAIYDLARMFDSVPYFTFNEAKQVWSLNFQGLIGDEVKHSSVKLDSLNQILNHGEGIGKKVYMEANNVAFEDPIVIQEYTVIATDNTPNIKADLSNFAIELNANVKDIQQIIIYGQQVDWDNVTGLDQPIQNEPYDKDRNKWVLTNNGFLRFWSYKGLARYENQQYLEVVVKFVNKTTYDNLTTEEKNNHRNLYIYFENNIIYLTELAKLWIRIVDDTDGIYKYDRENVDVISLNAPKSTDGTTSQVTYGTLYSKDVVAVWDNLMEIEAYATISKTIPMFIHNQSNYDDTVFYNQTSSEISMERSVKVLQSYIDNMSSETLIKTGIFDTWAEIPKEGELIDDYIVNSFSVVKEKEYYSCTFALTKYHAKKREYMEASTDLVLSTIPSEDIIDTLFLDKYIFKYSIGEDFTKNLYQSAFKKDYIHNFVIPQTSLKNLIMWSSFDNFGVSMDALFNQKPLSFTGNNNIFFSINAKNNFIWSWGIDNKGHFIPNYYANIYGITKQAIFELADSNNNTWFSSSLSGEPIKDQYETMHYTLQINYEGINNTIITEDFANCVLNGIQNNAKIFVYGRTHKPNEPIDMTYGVDVGNLITEVDTTNQIVTFSVPEQNIDYISLIITVDNKPILVKNYKEWQHTINSIKLYYSIENGYPIQTGVRPYNK